MKKCKNVLLRVTMAIWLVLVMLTQACAANTAFMSSTQTFKYDLTSDKCVPMQNITPDEVFASPRKVFAHYFDRFPLSIDNKYWQMDYYSTQLLVPEGEGGKWYSHGGFLRSRPVPVPVTLDNIHNNLKKEVRMALDVGIGGFTYNILSTRDALPQGRFMKMSKAAAEVDPRFRLVIMPDMASLGQDTNKVMQIVKELYNVPNIFRLNDGRVVLAPFLSESVTPQAWAELLNSLSGDGYKIAFVPTFLSLGDNTINKYETISYGMGTFGTPLPAAERDIYNSATATHKKDKIFMAGISGQGYRPKDFMYWESEGSKAYVQSWLGAIEGNTDWVQLTTWNDYSESTQISPYTDRQGTSGTVFYNLTAYYAKWYLFGREPRITHDIIYYIYRKEPVNAAAPKASGVTRAERNSGNMNYNYIEALAFLTAPGKITIEIGEEKYEKDAGPGISRFIVPLSAGVPHFSLKRNGMDIINFDGSTPVVGQEGLDSGFADLTYWGGSASANGVCFTP